MLTLALLSPALALVAKEACMGFFVADSVPRPAATEIPIDVVPTVIMRDDGCGGSGGVDVEFYRYDGDQGTLLGTTHVELVGSGPHLVAVDLAASGGPLQPLTNYMMRVVQAEGVSDVSAIGFTTGEATLVGLDEVPDLAVVSADANKSGGVWWLSGDVLVDPAADPDGLSIVLGKDTDGAALFADVVTADTLFTDFFNFTVEDVPKEFCVVVEQFDGAQRSTGDSEPDCLEVDKHRSLRGNCAVVPARASGLAALVALLLGLRRRR